MREIEPLIVNKDNVDYDAQIYRGMVLLAERKWTEKGARALHAWLTRALYGDAVVVPREPTEEMIEAATKEIVRTRGFYPWGDRRASIGLYRTMIAAAAKETTK